MISRALVMAYAVVALAVGLVIAATFALPCEGRGFCSDLDSSGGYILIIAGPPAAVLIAAAAARRRGRPGILHAALLVTVVTVPAVTFGLFELMDR